MYYWVKSKKISCVIDFIFFLEIGNYIVRFIVCFGISLNINNDGGWMVWYCWLCSFFCDDVDFCFDWDLVWLWFWWKVEDNGWVFFGRLLNEELVGGDIFFGVLFIGDYFVRGIIWDLYLWSIVLCFYNFLFYYLFYGGCYFCVYV